MKKSKIVIGTDSEGMFSIRKFLTVLLICVCCSSGLEAKANGTLCTATTSKHQPCKNQALNGQTTCYFHTESSKCAGNKANGKKCNALHLKDSKYCRFHQDQAK